MKKHLIHPYLTNPHDAITLIVAGCGGTGSQVINHLARINYTLRNLGHKGISVICYDDDVITEANCGRQLFAESEIGRYKAEVIISRVNKFYGTSWSYINSKFTGQKNANIIVSCVDSIKARVDIWKSDRNIGYDGQNEHALNFYWIDCGNSYDFGQVVLATTMENDWGFEHGYQWRMKSIFDLHPEFENKPESDEPSCSLAEAISKQDLFINTIIAEYAANLVWKLCTATELLYQGVYVNLNNFQTRPIPIT